MKRDSSNPKILVATILSMSLLTVMAGAAVAPAFNAISAHFADANPLLIQFVVSMPALFIILTTNWMSSGLASAKWALMAFKTGATAAPAITVSSDIERIVATRIFGLDESLFISKNLFN